MPLMLWRPVRASARLSVVPLNSRTGWKTLSLTETSRPHHQSSGSSFVMGLHDTQEPSFVIAKSLTSRAGPRTATRSVRASLCTRQVFPIFALCVSLFLRCPSDLPLDPYRLFELSTTGVVPLRPGSVLILQACFCLQYRR